MITFDDDSLTPERCLASTWFVDADDPAVRAFAAGVVADAGAASDRQQAVALFGAVRDGWRYDPYNTSNDPTAFRASTVLTTGRNWCVPKSVLLTAACRAIGVPARLGFADVRNHLQSEKLRETMGTDLFVFHGCAEMWIDGAWRQASSAFNRHMEYVSERGSYVDLPLDEMLAAFAEVYGNEWTDSDAADTDDAFR